MPTFIRVASLNLRKAFSGPEPKALASHGFDIVGTQEGFTWNHKVLRDKLERVRGSAGSYGRVGGSGIGSFLGHVNCAIHYFAGGLRLRQDGTFALSRFAWSTTIASYAQFILPDDKGTLLAVSTNFDHLPGRSWVEATAHLIKGARAIEATDRSNIGTVLLGGFSCMDREHHHEVISRLLAEGFHGVVARPSGRGFLPASDLFLRRTLCKDHHRNTHIHWILWRGPRLLASSYALLGPAVEQGSGHARHVPVLAEFQLPVRPPSPRWWEE